MVTHDKIAKILDDKNEKIEWWGDLYADDDYKNIKDKRIKEINEKKELIAKELNKHYQITIKQSKRYKNSICVTSGLINALYADVLDRDVVNSFISQQCIGILAYKPRNNVLELHLDKEHYYAPYQIANAIESVITKLCIIRMIR